MTVTRSYVFTTKDTEGKQVRGIVEAANQTEALRLARSDTRFGGAKIRDLKVATREDLIENALRLALARAERIKEVVDEPDHDTLPVIQNCVDDIIAAATKAL